MTRESWAAFWEVQNKLDKVGRDAEKISKQALYAGAGVAADAYGAAISEIKTEKFKYAGEGETRLPSQAEKNVLKAGVARFRSNGSSVETVIGLQSGYAYLAGHKTPIMKIARAINSGTSFMHKQPFVRKAKAAAKNKGAAAIVEAANKLIDEIIKE